ncbi:MAG: branched-chain amino acid ABC transporter permease [Actinomycetota bacterium]|jgi:branched-chain amino acid transport system permease protein|nr:branched-chain amino acid ABC transporter permease [Actinomycetota bacterium]
MLLGIIDGILTGGVYALMASGLTLIFGVMEVISVAQGIFVILGAYLSYSLEAHFGIDLFLGLFITIPALFIVGIAVEWAFLRRLKAQERIAMSILVTYAVFLIIEGVLNIVYGTNYFALHAWYVTQSVELFGVYLSYIYIFGFLLAAGLLAALYVVLYRTRFGASVRAAMQDRTAASLVGVDVRRVSTITFGIGTAVTAAGGMIYGATNSFNANSAEDLISRLLVIVVLGGLGSIGGALAAAVLMLVIEDVVAVVWSPDWATVIFFLALVAVLSIRPVGLFGRQAARAQ